MYLIQVTAYTGILYLVYALLLRNKPIHAFNRAYLLGAALLPIAMPFIKLPSFNTYFEKARMTNVRMPEVIASGGYEKQVMTQSINWLLVAYVAVAVVLFALFIYKRIRLQMVIRKSTRVQEKGYTILLNTTFGPGSWGRYIFLPDETINETIIQHEAAHVYMKHSTDVVIMQLLQCLFWPNLFLYAIHKELKQLHEFQADAAVGMDRLQYSELLLSNVFDTCTLPLTHSFNVHPIKRRITMLKKRKSPLAIVFGGVALVAAAVVVLNVVALQSCKPKKWEVMQALQVDKGAEFDGDLNEYISNNIKYPKEAMDNGIEGRVVIGFKIDEEGNVKDPRVVTENYSYVNGANGNGTKSGVLVAAALDVIHKMPKWIPAEKDGRKVAMYYQQPFTFKIGRVISNKITNDETKTAETPKKERLAVNKSVDKTKSMTFKIKNVNANDIKEIDSPKEKAEAILKKVTAIIENDGSIPMKGNGEISIEELDGILSKLEANKNSTSPR